MKAVTYHGRHDMRVDNVPDPRIENSRDAIIRITSTAICGSDLHIYNGMVSGMREGDVIGHEPMGIVEEVGSAVSNLKKGDRVVVPFTISCGGCFFCSHDMYSLCDVSNPKQIEVKKHMGHSPAGMFGYSHLTGGFPGGQAEYLHVPYSDIGPIKIPDHLDDEKVLFLSDVFPTGWMAADNCNIEPTDTVAVWGCGPVGQFALQSARLMGARRLIAIDEIPERLSHARDFSGAEVINRKDGDVYEILMEMTQGRGPDKCIEAVGSEAHGANAAVDAKDNMMQVLRIPSDHPYALNEVIKSCRKGGIISMPGAYMQSMNVTMGAVMNKALTIRSGQTHVQKYLPQLLGLIDEGKIDPSFIITHRVSLVEAAAGYKMFNESKDKCLKVVLRP